MFTVKYKASVDLCVGKYFLFWISEPHVCDAYYHPLLSNFFKFPKKQGWWEPKWRRRGGARGQSRGWSGGGWGAVGDQWCWDIKIKVFLLYSNSHISCSSWSLRWIYLSFSWWCGIAKSISCSSWSSRWIYCYLSVYGAE